MKLAALVLSLVLAAATAAFDPAAIADQGTIEFLTVGPEEGEHWSTVWFVVIDETLYLRLGPRAVERIDKNSTAPEMKIRTADGAVHPVRYEKAPDMAATIADAMAAKYWSDVLGEPFRKLGLTASPLMLRLEPARDPTTNR